MPRTVLDSCRSALETFYDALYPPRCGVCEIAAGFICSDCRKDLLNNASACVRCATPLESGSVCGECLADPPPWSHAFAPLRYAFPLDFAIKRFKFHGAQHYLPMFTELLRPACESLPFNVDAVQPMPLHWRRHAWRGFNQAVEIARPVARMLDRPVRDDVRRRGHTPPQSSLPSQERRRDLSAYFRARRPVPHGHILIVDDVLTTGASAAALTRCLLGAGAREVSVLTLARS